MEGGITLALYNVQAKLFRPDTTGGWERPGQQIIGLKLCGNYHRNRNTYKRKNNNLGMSDLCPVELRNRMRKNISGSIYIVIMYCRLLLWVAVPVHDKTKVKQAMHPLLGVVKRVLLATVILPG